MVMVLAAGGLCCAGKSKLPSEAGYGANPTLPEPQTAVLPVLKVLKAAGWPAGATPVGPPGTTVNAFASGLDHPRWLFVLPNGDVLVAETNAPPRPEDAKGIKGAVMKQVMKRTGAAVPSANRITLLRDADGDGVAEIREPFLENLSSPFGMALVGSELYVANAEALVRFPYSEGQTRITVRR